MKKLFILLVLSVISVSVFAQSTQEFKSVLGISPISLYNKVRIKYEGVLSPKLTVGGTVTGYYGSFPGGQIAPLARFYFKANAPEGFYAQAKAVAGYYSHILGIGDDHGDNDDYISTEKAKGMSFGGGIALGYQLFWGSNDRWSIDVNVGAKFTTLPFKGLSGLEWILWGPGSIIDGLVSVGYRF
jgi:hypothetical protein